MKGLKVSLVFVVAALLTGGFSGMAYAFHSGGVAECGGCHSMHSPRAGGSSLLVGTDPSSTCLVCHEHAGDTAPSNYHVSTASADLPAGVPPIQRTPGGDFGWLRKSYTFNVRGTNYTEDGASFGHNIVAADNGYFADTIKTISPGGNYQSSNLGCQSCHDPHGRFRRLADGTIVAPAPGTAALPIKASGSYNGDSNEPTATEAVGVYRLLAGDGYTTGGVTFDGVPAAKAPSTYNQTEATNQVRVAYGVRNGNGHVTWGNWCGTCHGLMHSTGNYVHPVDHSMGSGANTVGAIYNAYVKTGDMSGTQGISFNSLVPFATNSGDYTVLAGLAGNANAEYPGPTNGDQVTCLSCHRAHATGFVEMLRWQMEGEFIVYNGLYPGIDNGSPVQFARGRTAAETQAAYYDRPVTKFASYQRVLCNKCHAKD